MRIILRVYLAAILIVPCCGAQQFPAVTAVPADPAVKDSDALSTPTATLLATAGQDRPLSYSFWPRPYVYGGLALSNGASYSPAAETVGGGLNVDSTHFIALAESSFQNAHKQDSGTGNEVDLKGRAFFRTSQGWFLGRGGTMEQTEYHRLRQAGVAAVVWRRQRSVSRQFLTAWADSLCVARDRSPECRARPGDQLVDALASLA